MATILACFGAMVLIAVTLIALQIGAAALARNRAEIAADMGALAGAAVVLDGPTAACQAAAQVVGANGATLDSCTVDGVDVLVTAGALLQFGPLTRRATARARAGLLAEQAP